MRGELSQMVTSEVRRESGLSLRFDDLDFVIELCTEDDFRQLWRDTT